MGLVASSKIRRATDAMLKSRAYATSLKEAVRVLAASGECASSPYIKEGKGKSILIVIAGDRGMAGGYNANVFRMLRDIKCDEYIPIGKRACGKLGKGFESCEKFTSEQAAALARKLCLRVKKGEVSKVGILFTRHVSVISQVPEIEWLLPLKGEKASAEALFEPDASTVLEDAVPLYVGGMIASRVKESFASEVASRRVAMDSAGKNAKQMTESLTLQYNRARQGAITQEITEIVAGSDA